MSVERQPKGAEAANVSSTESKAYQALARSLRELQPGTVVAPGLLIGGTNAIHFTDLAETILRFRPIHVTAKARRLFLQPQQGAEDCFKP